MITKENLEKKLAILQAQFDQQQANLNALLGAIKFTESLLKELEETPPTT